jgi:transglutaminase-like putative cysteine protease
MVLGIVIAGTGAVARWWRVPGPLVVLIQLVLSLMVASAMLCGSPIPIGASFHRLVATFRDAVDSANTYAPPVPLGVPGVHPLLIAGGLGCLLLVDVLACTMRRVPLAGLPLLTVYSVPVSMLGSGLTWWIFALTAAGFLSMLFLHESEQIARWGRPLGDETSADPTGFGVSTGAVRTSAGAIGSIVTALAIFVPIIIPTLDVHVFDFGAGAGNGNDISINNPMVDLRRDLHRGDDIPLLTVTTNDPDPTYLRIAVLTEFDNDQWRAGDRQVPPSNRANGDLPPLAGVNNTVLRHDYHYTVSAQPEFRSTWLPTTQDVAKIDASGDWRYDPAEMDFLASQDDLTTAGLTWSFTAVKLDLDADALARSGSTVSQVSHRFLDLPTGISPTVRNYANEVTRDEPTKFQKAVALQNWFRDNFTYDDTVQSGDSADDLAAFLNPANGGRRGYCQQFAASMAVMARYLGIPARVAVGFLAPDKTGPDTYVYSAHDMHAWPELYFAGAGWVRFEPTPAGRAGDVPSYTTQPVTVINPSPSAINQPSTDVPSKGSASAGTEERRQQGALTGDAKNSSFPWLRVLAGIALVVLLVLVAIGPGLVRRRRRDRRRGGGPEEAWAELRDTAIDLRVPWPQDRTPRQTRDLLVTWFGAASDEFEAERPRRGPDTNPDAVYALDRIVLALERLRYARADGSVAGTWSAEIQSCVEALYGGAPRRTRRAASWWPRSVFVRSRPVRVRVVEQPTDAATYGSVVDHVG